jgi:RNA polymerase sigma-70 factor, ECF subfamily
MTAPLRSQFLSVINRTPQAALGATLLQEQNAARADAALRRGAMAQDGLSLDLPGLLPRLWRFALRLAGDRHDAEDLVQRACVRALERRNQLQPGTSTLSWLFSIVHSVWLSEDLADTVADPAACDPEIYTLHQQIISAVEKLPDAQRAVMLLVAVEGLSYREAASVLDVPIGTVMSRLARARLTIGESFETRSAQTGTTGLPQ